MEVRVEGSGGRIDWCENAVQWAYGGRAPSETDLRIVWFLLHAGAYVRAQPAAIEKLGGLGSDADKFLRSKWYEYFVVTAARSVEQTAATLFDLEHPYVSEILLQQFGLNKHTVALAEAAWTDEIECFRAWCATHHPYPACVRVVT